MKLFSRIVFICNLSFILSVILRYVEFSAKKRGHDGNIIPLPFVTGLLVILGQCAIFINFIFCLVVLILLLLKKINPAPRWLIIANILFLMIQVYYYFI